MNDKIRLAFLVLVRVLVAVASVLIWSLYPVSMVAEKTRLAGVAQAQLLAAVARFDQKNF